jgi:hypothetical protein
MNPVMLQNFLSIALPIILTFIATIWLASWSQNKRLDDIVMRLTRIGAGLKEHGEKIAALDERTSMFGRRG